MEFLPCSLSDFPFHPQIITISDYLCVCVFAPICFGVTVSLCVCMWLLFKFVHLCASMQSEYIPVCWASRPYVGDHQGAWPVPVLLCSTCRRIRAKLITLSSWNNTIRTIHILYFKKTKTKQNASSGYSLKPRRWGTVTKHDCWPGSCFLLIIKEILP